MRLQRYRCFCCQHVLTRSQSHEFSKLTGLPHTDVLIGYLPRRLPSHSSRYLRQLKEGCL